MGTKFQDLRQNAHLSRKAAADYLAVNLSTVNRWDNGKSKPPFAVCELLRCIAGELPDLSLRRCFSGWRFAEDYIYTPDGERYTPDDIKELFIIKQQLRAFRVEVRELKSEIKRLTPDGKPIMNSNVLKFPTPKTIKQGSN
jgi:DNA-binding XRE family transcriptional regulator